MTPRYRQHRSVKERIVLSCMLVLEDALHLGGADADAYVRPLLRDGDGQIYIAGTALKGVLRSKGDCERLFGTTDAQACLIVDDAVLVESTGTELRRGVRIEPSLGIAADKHLYDIELLSAGSIFKARFEALVPEPDHESFLNGLCRVLERVTDGLKVGARTRRGLGKIRRRGPWCIQRFAGASGLRAWLAEGCDAAPASWRQPPELHTDLWQAFGLSRTPQELFEEKVKIELELKLVGSLLIRSPSSSNSVDCGHIHSLQMNGEVRPVVSATSLAGALRARCRKIARTLLPQASADDLVDGLFGHPGKGKRPLHASRLEVSDAVIEGSQTLRHTRARIDPWTGGASDGALFTTEPVYGGSCSLVMRWRRPGDAGRERAEHALLLLALRDLVLGDLQLGGETGTGRGRFAPLHDDKRFGYFGATSLKLNAERGIEGDFREALCALKGWTIG